MTPTICPKCGGRKHRRAELCFACRHEPPSGTRVCTGCRRELPLEAFRVRTRKTPRPRSVCKACESQAQRARLGTIRSDPKLREQRNASKRRWAAENPGKTRAMTIRRLLRKANVAVDPELVIDLDRRLGACEACGRPVAEVGKLRVDHCHRTGTFRGLVCDACNLGLGKFGDDPDRLRAAASYLERLTPPGVPRT